MIIPEGVNFLNFYNTARSKGILVRSRYTGVYINNSPKQGIAWTSQYHGKAKPKFIGRFPFTFEGEQQASNAYQQYLLDNKIIPRYSGKRKINKSPSSLTK